jgi:hypothetical protein
MLTLDDMRARLGPVRAYIANEKTRIAYDAEKDSTVIQWGGFILGLAWLFLIAGPGFLALWRVAQEFGLFDAYTLGWALGYVILAGGSLMLLGLLTQGWHRLNTRRLIKKHPILPRAINLSDEFDRYVTSTVKDEFRHKWLDEELAEVEKKILKARHKAQAPADQPTLPVGNATSPSA